MKTNLSDFMDSTPRIIPCKECGTEFETTWPGFIDRCDVCSEAADERIRQQQQERAEAAHKASIEALEHNITRETPPRFRATDIKHTSFNRKAWALIGKWNPTDEKPWLFLVGTTGGCKTRMAFLLARRIIVDQANNGRKTTYLFGSSCDLSQAALDQFGKAEAKDAKDLLRKYLHSDLVMIDDLGKGRLTPAVAAEVYAIIDHRHKHNLATIITANSMPDRIAEAMAPDMASPFAGRINECSVIYNLG
jgi:DNA replication protein DnaC